MMQEHELHTDLTVVGSGMAGLASACFAADRGFSVSLVGRMGATGFSSGLLDLLGAFPGEGFRGNPWQALQELETRFPRHPLNKVEAGKIAYALERFCEVLAGQGLGYKGFRESNVLVPTQLGTVRPAYRVPHTMWTGIEAFHQGRPCLLLDIEGMKDFDAEGMASSLAGSWPKARSDCICVPGFGLSREAPPLLLAYSLENGQVLREVASSVASRLKPSEVAGFPAVLGVHQPDRIMEKLQDMIGAPVFEVPTMPNTVPGTRIGEAFRSYFLPGERIRFLVPGRIHRAREQVDGDFRLEVEDGVEQRLLRSSAVILASGRFLAQGLQGGREKILEPLFDLPVAQPKSRSEWHSPELFDPAGHGADWAGLETDSCFRPVDQLKRPLCRGLFVAGSILAHADWTRFKCGAGMCISSAFQAVECAASYLSSPELRKPRSKQRTGLGLLP